jgi:hypothetical protein
METDLDITVEKLFKIGKTYEVVFEDCCVRGEFTAKVVRRIPSSKTDSGEVEFDNGLTMDQTIWGKLEVTEVSSGVSSGK